MKTTYSFLIIFFISYNVLAQQPRLQKLWETDTIMAVPESVLPIVSDGLLYVSLIDGAAWAVDSKGGIGKLNLEGEVLDANWITGLNAPKGMGIVGNYMYVADVTQVAVINIKKGIIEKRIVIDSAIALNDIAVTQKGEVFVSDSRAGKIHQIRNNKASLYLANLPNVNGLKVVGNDLLIAAGKNFVKANAKKQLSTIAILQQGGDGVEPVGNGDYLVTSWIGYVYYVYADGRVVTLLETHGSNKNTADIGYDPIRQIMYLPTFNGKTVAAYKLEVVNK